MKIHALLISSGLLFAITGAATAADHLFQAMEKGHISSTAVTAAGEAPGRGSPFTGNPEDAGIPSTDTGAARTAVLGSPDAAGRTPGKAGSAQGHTSDHTAH
jgi:hypothetical protein